MANNDLRNQRRRNTLTIPALSENWIKNAGTVMTALYFFAYAVIQNGLLGYTSGDNSAVSELMSKDSTAFALSGIASVCYLIGVCALPIYAFLLAEGIQYTSSVKKYVLLVLAAAVISEVPYDLAVTDRSLSLTGRLFNISEQNPMWAVLISLIMLWLLKIFRGKGFGPVVIDLLIVFGGCFWAIFLKCKFGGIIVLLTAAMYLLRDYKGWRLFAGIAICLVFNYSYITTSLGFIPIALYSGERKGTEKKSAKYFYYVFYPVMFMVFAAIVCLL